MKSFVAFLIGAAISTTLYGTPAHANEQQQTFDIGTKSLDISTVFHVKQFDPNKGTLTWVSIQSSWSVDSNGGYEIDLSLVCPGPSSVSQSFQNTLTDTGNGHWGLGIGIGPTDTGFNSYAGEGILDFTVDFTGVFLELPATGSLHLTVTYTYTH